MKKLRMARAGYNAISTVFFGAAVVYLAFPSIPPLAVCWFCGITLLAYGTIKIIGYFSEDLFCLAFRYDLAFGLLLLALGVVVLMKQTAMMGHLMPGLGWATLLDGFFKIQMSEEAKKFGLKHWSVLTAAAILTSLMGGFLIVDLFGPEIQRLLIALALLAEGAMNRCAVKLTVKKPEQITPAE